MNNTQATRGIALLTGGVLAATALAPATAAHAVDNKTYKYGAIGLGALGAILVAKGKTLPGAIAGAGAYYSYKKSKENRDDYSYRTDGDDNAAYSYGNDSNGNRGDANGDDESGDDAYRNGDGRHPADRSGGYDNSGYADGGDDNQAAYGGRDNGCDADGSASDRSVSDRSVSDRPAPARSSSIDRDFGAGSGRDEDVESADADTYSGDSSASALSHDESGDDGARCGEDNTAVTSIDDDRDAFAAR